MNPTSQPRPGVYPFWFWNGVQSEAIIREQLEAMQTGGCRGVVLHSRTGNQIPYLSDRWFELVRYSCQCAQELGIKIWLYDEDGYPSGNAGMQIQKLRPDLRQKHLTFEYSATDPEHPGYAAYDATTYALLDESKAPKGTAALRFKIVPLERHVDTLNPETSALFLSLTHAKYEHFLSDYFGSVIEAVYTDDESFLVWNARGIVWSETLEAACQKRFGISLKAILPLLVEDLPGYAETRRNFYSLAREMFLENFIKPQVDWCHRFGLAYTGHLCGDEGPTRTSIKNFGTPMPYLLIEDIPAIDDYLCELRDHDYLRTPINGPDNRILNLDPDKRFTLFIYKCASSISNQFKDGLLSAEDITYLGWDIQPGFLNTQMLFELGMGVNLMTPHAYYYTIGDKTKYDCPPSYFTQQPLYPIFGKRCATWTHLAELLTRGKYHADCLVIYPDNILASENGEDMGNNFRPHTPRAGISPDDFDLQFSMLLMELTRRHIGYDLGDETILCTQGIIHSGVMNVGNRSYQNVIVFPGVPLTPEADKLIEQFQLSGGRVITPPHGDYTALDTIESDVKISGDGCEEILVHARDNGDFRELFLLNLSGKTLKPHLSLEDEFSLYDPIEQKCIFCGTDTPETFILEPGAVCLLLPKHFESECVPFTETAFCGNRNWQEISPVDITMTRHNIAAFHDTTGFAFALEEGARVVGLYTEHVASSGLTMNGVSVLDGNSLPHHPCDFCFEGVDVSTLCHAGENRIDLAAQRDMVYLEGEFSFDNGKLTVPRKPVYGNLAEAGYPHYWGGVDYHFTFNGKHDLLRFDLDGAAEVSVNGQPAGVIFGKPSTLHISSLCIDGENTIIVHLSNSAANFVTAKPVPFGIIKTEIA